MIITADKEQNDTGRYHIWLHLAKGDPTEQSESMILGSGHSLQEAKTDAIRSLGNILLAVDVLDTTRCVVKV